MIKKTIIYILIITVLTGLCSCTLLVKPLNKNMHFSDQLSKLDDSVRNEKWSQAEKNLEEAKKAWKRLKPWIQVDIDHDYVHEIEENLAKLEGYIETEEKPDALAHLLMIQETWEDIESL